MGELVFPLAAVAITFLVVIPALTWLSRTLLVRRRRASVDWASFGSETNFALLVAPVLLPVVWLTSSAFHQSESSSAGEPCLVGHAHATTCLDSVLLLGLLVGGMTLFVGISGWRERRRVRLDWVADDHSLARRVASLIASEPTLRGLRAFVVRDSDVPVFTVGLLRPRVGLDTCFVRDADDDVLKAALLHESVHAASYDTLRGFLARLCLRANPAGRMLVPELRHWHAAREAQCDGEAIARGGNPLALAEGILRAARFRCAGAVASGVCALCGHDAATLKLRIALLLEGPRRPRRTAGHVALVIALLAALVVPHLPEAGLLAWFHYEVERSLHFLH